MWELVAACLWAHVAADWRAAMETPADVALSILDARDRLMRPPEKERDDSPTWTDRPGGGRTMSFSSIEGLAAAVKASGGTGFNGAVKVGKP
jgi:hypothetical protein